MDEELEPQREEAMRYYEAQSLGNEEDGRSKVVMSTVRDTVLKYIPSLMRTCFGTQRAIEFVPSRVEKVNEAEQQSKYVTWLIRNAPNALLEAHAAMKDGLRCRLGFVKWWYDPQGCQETYDQTGLSKEQVALYEADPSVAYLVTREYEEGGVTLYDCAVTYNDDKGRIRWAALPPEEVIYSPEARNFNEATFVGHRQELTVGALVAMGFDKKDIIEFAKQTSSLANTASRQERDPDASDHDTAAETSDESSWLVPVVEAFVRVDEDQDDITELRKYWLVGDAYKPLKDPAFADSEFFGVAVRRMNMASWSPDPEPHLVEGRSTTDLTKDLQRVDSALIRANLDSLGLALHNRVAFQEGAVNLHDLMNTEVGAAIRTTTRPSDVIFPITHAYVGKDAFPLMEWVRGVREERTGQSKESEGLGADALQSSSKVAVAATLSSAQGRQELIARFFLEGIMVPLARGLSDLVVQHQNRKMSVRINGKFTEIDPSLWDRDADCQVSLMLGGGLQDQKIQSLTAILQKQETYIQTLGPANPLVNLSQLSNTLLKLVELAGWVDSESYFNRVTPEQAAQAAQASMNQPPKEDPATMLAKANIELQQRQQALAEQKFQLDVMKFQTETQLKEEQQRQELLIRTQEMELRYSVQIDEMMLERMIRSEDAEMRAIGEAMRTKHQSQIELTRILSQHKQAREKVATDAAVKIATAKINAEAKKETDAGSHTAD